MTMGIRSAAAFAMIFALGEVGAAAEIRSAPLEIMVEDAAALQSQKDGTGYANDIVRAAFAAADVKIKLTVVPYSRCKASVMAGQVAACFSMSWDPAFEGVLRLSAQPLYQVYASYYRVASPSAQAMEEAAIAPSAVVGLVNGYEYPPSTMALGRRGVSFAFANSEAVNLRKLAAGRLDFAVLMLSDIKRANGPIKEAGVTNVVEAFRGQPIGSHVGFSLRHAQGEAALASFNRGFELIRTNGEQQRIFERWLRREQ